MTRYFSRISPVLLVFMVLFSCQNKQVFEKYSPINEAIWHKDSLVVFNVPVSDTSRNHNLLLGVRNDIQYPFSNLWLFIDIAPPGGEAMTDTFEIVLASPSGEWLGQGMGGIKTRQVMFKRNVVFSEPGNYRVSIRHGMRKKLLKGIHDIGFKVEKIN